MTTITAKGKYKPKIKLSQLQLLIVITCFILFLSSSNSLHPPKPRSYHSHAYYVIETFPNHSSHEAIAQQLAKELETEFVEQVGQLQDFWLVKAPKSWVERGYQLIDSPSFPPHHRGSLLEIIQTRDAIVERFELIKRSIHDPQLARFELSNHHLIHSIRSIERQVLRTRHKRDSIYAPSEDGLAPVIARDQDQNDQFSPPSTKLSNHDRSLSLSQSIAQKFKIYDPLWPKQWHLVNNGIPKHMINATGVWDLGITGQNVTVAIVDDGLDMTSDDLKDNFFEKASWDYNDHTPLPEPRLNQSSGSSSLLF